MTDALQPLLQADFTVDARLRYVAQIGDGPVLNLGSGVNPVQGAINHVYPEPALDGQVSFDLTTFPWPLPQEAFLMVSAFHVLEHIPVHLSLRFMEECHRVLVPAGTMVLEVPDIVGQARELVNGNRGMLGWMYGQYHRPGEGHLWGWDASQLMIVSRLAGFRLCITKPGTDYHSVQIPTVRLEAVKSDRV
jgi:SAM-dependent methyltransferase